MACLLHCSNSPPSRCGDKWAGRDPISNLWPSGDIWPSSTPSVASRLWLRTREPDMPPAGMLRPELAGPPPVIRIRGPSGPLVYLNPAIRSPAPGFTAGRSELEYARVLPSNAWLLCLPPMAPLGIGSLCALFFVFLVSFFIIILIVWAAPCV